MKNSIYNKFTQRFECGYFIRIGDNRDINLYIGKDENAHYSIDFRGNYHPAKIVGSKVIEVSQFTLDDIQFLRFSLLNSELLECFSLFCCDLINSTKGVVDDETAYKQLQTRYLSWKRMFKPNRGLLSESEIMGLIGELLYMKDNMIPTFGIDAALESWTGPEHTHKDYSMNSCWYEIKTISSGKESVRISSLEQLDSDIDGSLIVYSLERMSPSFNGIKLNDLVAQIIELIPIAIQRDLFLAKLELYGYDFSPEYDNFVFAVTDCVSYKVIEGFPRLVRRDIPISVSRIQYEIILSEIETFKV
jgi:hypothetical protein